MVSVSSEQLKSLASRLEGELHTGTLMRTLYATDASAYQEMPLAVAIPRSEADIVELIRFANSHQIGLIPRAAGTSLAGQVVGTGIVVDVSRHFTSIREINVEEGWVSTQPGVIRNELNRALAPHGLLFGPETSTQNRAMLGGMLGNNSCGSNSIKYGSVRDHIMEVTALLSDGTKAVFGSLDSVEFALKCMGPDTLETRLYQQMRFLLGNEGVRAEIAFEFPKPSIPRRNTGYALDMLMDASCFEESSNKSFNFGKLIAGSEGTLCFVTEIKLHCNTLPPPVIGLLCIHFTSVYDALLATQIAVTYDCYACELIDRYILDCTERSIEHRENRFFVEGSPEAILVVEVRGETEADVLLLTEKIECAIRVKGLGYAFPLLFGDDTEKIWNLRKAGLGLMSNKPGDEKPVPVIEDTAVDVADLPAYIKELDHELKKCFGLECVHYAHAGSGEIHLRPIINLKTSQGNRQFREVAQMVAELVKKYRGSLSGEHGDGRLRGEFLRKMIGELNYSVLQEVKSAWDSNNIFNPGKIIDAPPMNEKLRYDPNTAIAEIKTEFDWSSTQGVLRAAEMCNGSGDCRKIHLAGGTMCPSYMATRNEKDSTRGRANMLRNVLTNATDQNPWVDDDLKDVLDLCLSCKGCKKECPSTVDMAKMKAEFQQQYYDAKGAPFRSRMIAISPLVQNHASKIPWAWNFVFKRPALRKLFNRMSGFHPDRTVPLLSKYTMNQWFHRHTSHRMAGTVGRVLLFNDEFTNHNDVEVGVAAVELLELLGYAVEIAPISLSSRTWLSKGFVRKAKQILNENIRVLAPLVTDDCPLVGIEPSAILTFRDEAIDLSEPDTKGLAQEVAGRSFTIDEFISNEVQAGRVSSKSFTEKRKTIYLHDHCFQKALGGSSASASVLSLPKNYSVEVIPSGCCGMAGSFGYEREHFEISNKIAEMVLFPAVRKTDPSVVIAASGTSCRHQIHDGADRKAFHPAIILREAIKDR
ncbi:MAG: FAD-binding protein [Opitutales bacterium]|jgi:FAD/FMN-containing dehydrogenase/Fe-S oxidoreductase|nr:FAD-binding protein [Opitutales bacterium]